MRRLAGTAAYWQPRVLMAAGALLASMCGLAAAPLETKVLSPPKPLTVFNLEDHAGRPFANAQLMGRWSLVMLGFTHCPDVCPFTLQNLDLVLEQLSTRLSPERLPQVVFLAVDPDRDRPVLADYIKHFNHTFVGITGAADEVKALVGSLDGYVRIVGRHADATSYQVHHSAVISLIDPDARVRATLNPPMEPAAAAEFLAAFMRRAATDHK